MSYKRRLRRLLSGVPFLVGRGARRTARLLRAPPSPSAGFSWRSRSPAGRRCARLCDLVPFAWRPARFWRRCTGWMGCWPSGSDLSPGYCCAITCFFFLGGLSAARCLPGVSSERPRDAFPALLAGRRRSCCNAATPAALARDLAIWGRRDGRRWLDVSPRGNRRDITGGTCDVRTTGLRRACGDQSKPARAARRVVLRSVHGAQQPHVLRVLVVLMGA